MSMQTEPEPAADTEATPADDFSMPAVEALVAGTLALMTGHAQACCTAQRELIAEKTSASLLMLSRHPLVSPGFRAVAMKLHGQWVSTRARQADVASAPYSPTSPYSPQSRALWHITPEVIQ